MFFNGQSWANMMKDNEKSVVSFFFKTGAAMQENTNQYQANIMKVPAVY